MCSHYIPTLVLHFTEIPVPYVTVILWNYVFFGGPWCSVRQWRFQTSCWFLLRGSIIFGLLDPWRWDEQDVPKRRCDTTVEHRITAQTNEDRVHIAAEVCHHVLFRYQNGWRCMTPCCMWCRAQYLIQWKLCL
jgi:hypothetical protein